MKSVLRRRTVFLVLASSILVAGAIVWWQWPKQYLRQGEKELLAREYDRARQSLARYLRHRPRDPHARLLAARAARRLREYHEAHEHLRLCRASGGDTEAIDIETVLIAVQRGEEPGPALRERARAKDELALVVLEVLVQSDIDAYRLNLALHGLTEYLESRPGDLQALLARGFVWERFLYFAEALIDYRKAVEIDPSSDQARRKLAQMLLLTGTPEEALEQYQWLLERRPREPEVRLGLARCHRRLGNAEESLRLLTDLLKETPENGELLWERGELARERGQHAEAEPWFRKAVQASPHDRRIVYSLYQCLLRLDRHAEAKAVAARIATIDADLRRIARIRKEVMIRPDDVELRCEGGLLFLEHGEREEGIRWLRQAIRLDPNCERALEALAKEEARSSERK